MKAKIFLAIVGSFLLPSISAYASDNTPQIVVEKHSFPPEDIKYIKEFMIHAVPISNTIIPDDIENFHYFLGSTCDNAWDVILSDHSNQYNGSPIINVTCKNGNKSQDYLIITSNEKENHHILQDMLQGFNVRIEERDKTYHSFEKNRNEFLIDLFLNKKEFLEMSHSPDNLLFKPIVYSHKDVDIESMFADPVESGPYERHLFKPLPKNAEFFFSESDIEKEEKWQSFADNDNENKHYETELETIHENIVSIGRASFDKKIYVSEEYISTNKFNSFFSDFSFPFGKRFPYKAVVNDKTVYFNYVEGCSHPTISYMIIHNEDVPYIEHYIRGVKGGQCSYKFNFNKERSSLNANQRDMINRTLQEMNSVNKMLDK